MKKSKLLVMLIAVLALSVSASATVIQPTAVVSEEYVFNSATKTIDNAGMQTAVNEGDTLESALAATHTFAGTYGDSYVSTDPGGYPSDFFASLGDDTGVDIVYDLGADKSVGGALLWQYENNGGGPGSAGNDAKTIEIYVNTEAQGSATFTGPAVIITMLPVEDADEDTENDLGGVNSAQVFTVNQTGRYVKIVITDNYYDTMTAGGDRVGLGEVRFTTENPLEKPYATNPGPYDTEIDVAIDTSLTWTGPETYTATGFDLIYGTDPNLDVNGTLVPGLTEETYAFTSDLLHDTEYFWRVDSYEDVVKTEGPMWSFTTVPANPVVSDPVSVTAALGSTATLTVTHSSGTSYKWFKGEAPYTAELPIAAGVDTITLDITPMTQDDEGLYHCEVYNSAAPASEPHIDAVSDTARVMYERLVAQWTLDGTLAAVEGNAAENWDGDYIDPNEFNANPDDNTVVYVEGADGNATGAVQFDGELMVEIPGSEEFFDFHTQGLTLTAWLLGPSGGDWHRALDKTDSYGFIQHASNSIVAQVSLGGWQNAIPAAEGSEEKWRFVAVSYDPVTGEQTTYGVYDDDDIIDVLHSSAVPMGQESGANPLRIGGRSPETEYNYQGAIDDVRVYNYPLTPSELQTVFAEVSSAPLCMNLTDETIEPFDFNKDCQVNLEDFAVFAAAWLNSNVVNP